MLHAMLREPSSLTSCLQIADQPIVWAPTLLGLRSLSGLVCP